MTSPGYAAAHHTHPIPAADGHPVRALALAPEETPAASSHPSPDDDLVISLRQSNQALVLTVAGSVDLVTAPNLRRVLELALVSSPGVMVVDLSAVDLLACAGLSVLVAAHRLAEGRTCLRVATSRRATRRPLALTGVDRYLSVYGTCAEALTGPLRAAGERPAATVVRGTNSRDEGVRDRDHRVRGENTGS